jgi:hypothetical protein
MDREKPSTRHLRLDHLGSIKARFVGHHRSVGDPAWNQDVNSHPGAVQVLRHDRAERLERGLGWPVCRGAGIQHRAKAGRNVDDPAQPWCIMSGTMALLSAN